ncbi:MAG: hypothetical protein RBS26_05920 [Sulfuricurvum sp.]|nr:hypothetical protein [Sulfuricurvum sp.]
MTRTRASLKPSASDRVELMRCSLTKAEYCVFLHKAEKIKKAFSDNGFLLNYPEFFRVLLLNLDNPILLKEVLNIYQSDSSEIFKLEKESK